MYTIPGNPPNLANEVKGDAFAVRNPYALNIDFEEEPPMFEINEHHQAAYVASSSRCTKGRNAADFKKEN